jgi:DNA polymerase III epsilon subunit-like protein
MLIMIYDTETSGLPKFNEPSEGENQPHICEIAALLFDDKTRQLEETLHYIVLQDGWDVDPEALKAHGITKERSFEEGIDEWMAHAAFHALQKLCDVRVAHNSQFDDRIMRIAYKRYGDGDDSHVGELDDTPKWYAYTQEEKDAIADAFKARPSYCTMKTAQPILNLPATEAMKKSGRGGWKKPPSLAETYRHFFGEDFDGAHSALNDAKACARIYFKLTQNVDIGWLP